MDTLRELIAEDSRILSDPAPLVALESLGDNSVNLLVRVWTASGDLSDCRYDFMKRVKIVFDEKGISFPFPQREIRLIKED
jgi:small conductance mechanosensitive channel